MIGRGAAVAVAPLFRGARGYLRIVGHLSDEGGAAAETPARLAAIATAADSHCRVEAGMHGIHGYSRVHRAYIVHDGACRGFAGRRPASPAPPEPLEYDL